MEYLLIIAVILNLRGAYILGVAAYRDCAVSSTAGDYLQLKAFVAGVAFTFAVMYLVLFLNPQYIFPFLAFGAALKAWAFASCLFLFQLRRLPFQVFFEFGVVNGIMSILFVCLLFEYS